MLRKNREQAGLMQPVLVVVFILVSLTMARGVQNASPQTTSTPHRTVDGGDKPPSRSSNPPDKPIGSDDQIPDGGVDVGVKDWILTGLALLFAVGAWLLRWILGKKFEAERKAKLDQLEKKAEVEPEKLKPVWELARFTLESYFKDNLRHVRHIFYVSIVAMIAGFLVILWGIHIAIANPSSVKISLIASSSGILTEFVSLTFMVIYRSTLAQANEYVSVLERINTVGMAVNILDSMGDRAEELKDLTRADIIRLLLSRSTGLPVKSTKTNSTKG